MPLIEGCAAAASALYCCSETEVTEQRIRTTTSLVFAGLGPLNFRQPRLSLEEEEQEVP